LRIDRDANRERDDVEEVTAVGLGGIELPLALDVSVVSHELHMCDEAPPTPRHVDDHRQGREREEWVVPDARCDGTTERTLIGT
jgi:hypothetical protein